jgi:tripartite-type tricarboxylate transporter receptor subunit TctC
LPASVVTRLQTEVQQSLQDSEISKKLGEVGIIPVGSSAVEMATLMRKYTDDLSRLAKQAGIEPN